MCDQKYEQESLQAPIAARHRRKLAGVVLVAGYLADISQASGKLRFAVGYAASSPGRPVQCS